MHNFHYPKPFELECGRTLPDLTVTYKTYGQLNARHDNVVWVCHALTANADAETWWAGLIGNACVISPETHYIVCANILGSCYGTSGPLTTDPDSGKPYYADFPLITIRDMVRVHVLLREHLGISKIKLLMGGSMGGYQAIEWVIMEPDVIGNLFLVATSASESAWGIAVHATQRLAIEADATFKDRSHAAGERGLKAARAIGILTYRNYQILVKKQTDTDTEKIDHYRAASYIDYQGTKLMKRFNACSYWLLTKAMDSHHIARARGGRLETVLATIQQPALIVSVNSDILCPPAEQQFLAAHLPHSKLVEIDSAYGHDGFMVEVTRLSTLLSDWLLERKIFG